MSGYRHLPRRAAIGSTLATVLLIGSLATAAGASAASSVGPFELTGGPGPTIQVSNLLSLHQAIAHHSTAAAYGSGGRGAPASSSEIVITKKVDQSSPTLLKATGQGSHWKSGSLIVQKDGISYEAICMTDAFLTSIQVSGPSGQDGTPEESISIAYAKVSYHYGTGASCSGSSAPPIESTLVRLNSSASAMTARLDCLTARCRGVFGISLPSSACPGALSKCSFTGGVRVGLTGGEVRFHDGSTFVGGSEVGLGGAGTFAMGDGSVRVVQLTVPAALRPWLKGHRNAKIISWTALRGVGKAIVERELIGAPAKIQSAIPTVSASDGGAPTGSPAPAPGPTEPPAPAPQSLAITACSQPVPGTPTVVSVAGSLSPPRGGATVALTYTPVSGPPPLPSPIVHSVTTTASGEFAESFDRRQNGVDYGWEVVAHIDAGSGYAAASSPPCAIPIP